jgi:hypothetical protein
MLKNGQIFVTYETVPLAMIKLPLRQLMLKSEKYFVEMQPDYWFSAA